MSKLITSPSAKIKDYKGFAINVSEENGQFIGMAIDENMEIEFQSVKDGRAPAVRELEMFIDIYRKNRPQRLIIN